MGRLRPETVGVIVSQEILSAVVMKCSELEDEVRFYYRVVDSPMEISDAFGRFEHPRCYIDDVVEAPQARAGVEHATLRGL